MWLFEHLYQWKYPNYTRKYRTIHYKISKMLHFYWCKIQNVTISLIIFNAKNSYLKKSAMRGNENWFLWHQNPFNYVICDLKLVSDIKGQPWMISRPSERSCYVWKYHIRPKFWSQLDILPNILDILYQKHIFAL